MFRDYLCVLLSDCTSEPIGNQLARSNHDATLLAVKTLFGWVSDSTSWLTRSDLANRSSQLPAVRIV